MAFGPSARNPAPSASTCWTWRQAMQRSSETIGALAGALAKAQAELTNPLKVADGNHPGPIPERVRKDLSLRSLVRRTRLGPKVSQPARNSRGSDHRGRQGGWLRPAHHRVGTLLRGMDVLRLAGLPGVRDGRAAPDGELPSPMPGAMRCSPWWASPAKTTLMRLICRRSFRVRASPRPRGQQ